MGRFLAAASRSDPINFNDGNSDSSILSFNLGGIAAGFECENDRRTQAACRQWWTASPKIRYQLSLTVLPIVVDHALNRRIERSARRLALVCLNDRENRIGQRIGNAAIGQFRAHGLDQHLAGTTFDDNTHNPDVISRSHQSAGREIDELPIGGRGRLREHQQPRQDRQHRRRSTGHGFFHFKNREL